MAEHDLKAARRPIEREASTLEENALREAGERLAQAIADNPDIAPAEAARVAIETYAARVVRVIYEGDLDFALSADGNLDDVMEDITSNAAPARVHEVVIYAPLKKMFAYADVVTVDGPGEGQPVGYAWSAADTRAEALAEYTASLQAAREDGEL